MTTAQSAIPWHQYKLLAFDVETTGVDVLEDRIVTATTVLLKPHARPDTRTWIIDPGIEIPDEAAAIHGVTTDMAQAKGMQPDLALFEILARLAYPIAHGIPLVAFNAAFDLSMLEAECERHDVDGLRSRMKADRPVGPVIDPYVIDKAMSRRKGKRTLGAQVEHYGVPHVGAHSSAGDALATARLVPILIDRYPDLQGLSAGELHIKQVGWRADQQASLRSYFQREGKPYDDIDEGWPYARRLTDREKATA